MNYSASTILSIAGIFNLGFAIFHLMFWKVFHWKEDLASLSHTNRAIMQILNFRLTFVFLIMSYLAFFHQAELISTNLGKALLVSFSLFWLLRTLEQVGFFGIKNRISFALTLVFFAGGILHFVPAWFG